MQELTWTQNHIVEHTFSSVIFVLTPCTLQLNREYWEMFNQDVDRMEVAEPSHQARLFELEHILIEQCLLWKHCGDTQLMIKNYKQIDQLNMSWETSILNQNFWFTTKS